jgi:hypothetical protein
MADANMAAVAFGFEPPARQQAPAGQQALLRSDEPHRGLPQPRPEWCEQPSDLSSRPWC